MLYLIDSLAPGGAETSLASMAPYLGPLGIDLHVCYFVERAGVHDQLRDAGATLHRIDATRLGRILAFRRLIDVEKSDIVHTTLFEADQVGRLAGSSSRLPVISSLVSTGFELGSWRTALGLKARAAVAVDAVTARAVTAFHAVSEPVADVMSRRLLVDRDRFTVIPRGRDPDALGRYSAERRRDARERLGVDSSTPLVISIGREVLPKGHTTLLHALPKLAAAVPGVRLMLAGESGDQSRAIERDIRELGIGRFVDRLGHRDDVPDLLAAADVLAFPSSREGFPGTLIEALALECPIVASDIPSIRSIVERRDSGLLASLVGVGDSSALAESLADVLTRGRNDEILSTGRDLFENEFTTAAIAGRMAELYRSVISAN